MYCWVFRHQSGWSWVRGWVKPHYKQTKRHLVLKWVRFSDYSTKWWRAVYLFSCLKLHETISRCECHLICIGNKSNRSEMGVCGCPLSPLTCLMNIKNRRKADGEDLIILCFVPLHSFLFWKTAFFKIGQIGSNSKTARWIGYMFCSIWVIDLGIAEEQQ